MKLPLPTLLSQVLVAFTIECDNESEHRLPHRTTRHGSSGGPWLVSTTMWWNCLRFLPEEGIKLAALEARARTRTNLHGMRRWGYLTVDDPPRAAGIVLPTAKARIAQRVVAQVIEDIETRWQARFGAAAVEELRRALAAIVARMDIELPDCLPILGYGLTNANVQPETVSHVDPPHALAALLARVLLAFALEFESESEVSLAICADVLRIVEGDAVRIRDLPLASGVSKEALAVAVGFLVKRRLAVLESENRTKLVRLTAKGLAAREAYQRLLPAIEERWRERFGESAIAELSKALERIVSGSLWDGLVPYPEGWRAAVPKPETLPHFPMVLHRGGYPDGS